MLFYFLLAARTAPFDESAAVKSWGRIYKISYDLS